MIVSSCTWPSLRAFFTVLLETGAHVTVLEKRRTDAVTLCVSGRQQVIVKKKLLVLLIPNHKPHCF